MGKENYVLETPSSKLVQVAAIAAKYRDRPDMLMTVLIQVQKVTSVISREVTGVISREMNIPLPKVYSFVTFYEMLSVKPQGKYIVRMCKSAPCHVRGAMEIVQAIEEQLGIGIGETTEDGRFTLEYCPCLGLCESSPAIMINDKVYGNLTPETVKDVIKQYIREDVI
ncbi:MAG: NAD(P)H-dependent oxidoreductase subunit E [Clostridiales bacterium]|nr:NAD(P)H-dependent oxidoreductase subunit E [Clostridiales bacterium]